MTQEEKFEKAKRLYETANADQRYVLESLFPELRESEDEKIRKTLIEYFNAYPKDYYGELKKSHILAWLERQAQKPAWSEEDEKIYQSIIDDIVQENQFNGKQTDWLRNIKYRNFAQPQNRWKPSDEHIKAVKEAACYSSVFSEKTIDNLISLSKQLNKLREE